MRYSVLAAVMSIAVCFASQSFAKPDDCKAALVMSTYSKHTGRFSDSRLATYVSQEEYEKIKRDAGANAVIYNVPVGGSYADFQENARKNVSSSSVALIDSQSENILWTGLDSRSASTYSNCIQAEIASAPGIHMVPVSATETDIGVRIIYNVVGRGPNPMPVHWTLSSTALPVSLPAGVTYVTFARPNRQMTVAVNGEGTGDFLVLDILAAVPVKGANPPGHDDLAGRLNLLNFNPQANCQQQKQQMYEITGFQLGITGTDARSVGNRRDSVTQFDQIEALAKTEGCLN